MHQVMICLCYQEWGFPDAEKSSEVGLDLIEYMSPVVYLGEKKLEIDGENRNGVTHYILAIK